LLLWGHGDLGKFVDDHSTVVGYSDIDQETLNTDPPENRGILIKTDSDRLTITNDVLGAFPVIYGTKDGITYVGSDEETLLAAVGPVTLSPKRLLSNLIFQCSVGKITLWEEIDQLYANSVLEIDSNSIIKQSLQDPLGIRSDGTSMGSQLQRLVRKYTDPLDTFLLPMSGGFDSRTILAFAQRSERIRVRTYPISYPITGDYNVATARESAHRLEVADFKVLDFGGDYRIWIEPAIKQFGTMVPGVQTYLYAASSLLGQEPGIPIVSGIVGDVLSGREYSWYFHKVERTARNPAEQFKSACYCYVHEWPDCVLDQVLTFDWRVLLEELMDDWATTWDETEMPQEPIIRGTLIRLRNRTNHYVTYPWSCTDLWGAIVSPYYDRGYITWALAQPIKEMIGRKRQKRVVQSLGLWPTKGWPGTKGTAQRGNINQRTYVGYPSALWPLVFDGTRPSHDFFNPPEIKNLFSKGISGDKRSFYLLTSLQALAWRIQQGYVI